MNFIDLYSGPGGLSTGFEKEGFNCLLAIDNDTDACETYKLNHPSTRVIQRDINDVNPLEVKELLGKTNVDILSGGSPCQAFSTIGKRRNDDPRAKLFYKFIDFAEILQPKYLVFENVKGILSFQGGKVVEDVKKLLGEIGYNLEYKLINSTKLGIPQKRERVIFIGVKDCSVHFSDYEEKARNLIDVIGDLKLRATLPNHEFIPQRKLDLDRIKFVPEGRYLRSNRKGGLNNEQVFNSKKLFLKEGELKTQKYHKLDRNKPTPTVLTNWFTVRTVAHYDNRPFTAREVARIQSFEDSYVFSGSLRSVYKQIGNAVPPELGKYIARQIKASH